MENWCVVHRADRTALMWAARHGHLNVAGTLVSRCLGKASPGLPEIGLGWHWKLNLKKYSNAFPATGTVESWTYKKESNVEGRVAFCSFTPKVKLLLRLCPDLTHRDKEGWDETWIHIEWIGMVQWCHWCFFDFHVFILFVNHLRPGHYIDWKSVLNYWLWFVSPYECHGLRLNQSNRFIQWPKKVTSLAGFAALDQCREHLEMRAAVIMALALWDGTTNQIIGRRTMNDDTSQRTKENL